jgi:hypothetical protein
MTAARCFVLTFAAAFAGCGSAPPPALPDGMGRGLLQADTEPPAGATTYERPDWLVGQSFVLVRGDVAGVQFFVESVDATGYWLRSSSGVHLRRDRDLGNLGEWENGEPVHLLSPVDVRFHWPLWLGKRWSCEFVDRAPGDPPLTMLASYEVEDLDTVTVRAGTFEALRIVRTLQLPAAGDRVMSRTQVVWYAPSIGAEVRQILGDTEVELVEWRAPQ